MDTNEIKKQIGVLEKEMTNSRIKLEKLRRQMNSDKLKDYRLKDLDGNSVSLSSLFGDKNDLILVHNMGKGCSYCTMWADGFIGIKDHLGDRASFVMVSHDKPEIAKEFTSGRDWTFRILSNDDKFNFDMGFETDDGSPHPGISTFHKNDEGEIHRISQAPFGPGDDFCSVWHMLDMLKDGPNDWNPKYSY